MSDTSPIPFLTGGGEMGNLTRQYDWVASDANLRTLFEQAPVGVAILRGAELTYELANKHYLNLIGRATPDDIIGKPLLVALPELRELGFGALLAEVVRTGNVFAANEHKVDLLRNGRLQTGYFNFVYQPLRDPDNRISGVFVLAADVTELVLARHKIEANEAYLQRIFRNAAAGIAILQGPDLIIELANPGMCVLWGRTEAEVLGKPLSQALPEVIGQGFDRLLTGVIQTGEPFVGKELPVMLNRTGQLETVYFDFVYEALPDADGRINRVLVTTSEVTERVLAGQQVDQLLTRERELNELKSNFVTLASHEFRTPMGTILSSASLIGRYNGADDEEKRGRHVERIKSAVHSLTGLLNDFLSLSQMEQETMHGQPHPLDIVAFCNEVIDDMQTVVKPGQRAVYRHLEGPSAVTIDGQMLKNILINLLVNASKYSAERKQIELTTAVRGGQLLVRVKDQGIGIPDVDKENLFISFFRARNARHVQGTGLGLYIVKRYVDLLGGTIAFTSQLDSGTIFTIELPLSPFPPTV